MNTKVTHGELVNMFGDELGKSLYQQCSRKLTPIGSKVDRITHENQHGFYRIMNPSKAFSAEELSKTITGLIGEKKGRWKNGCLFDGQERYIADTLEEFIEKEKVHSLRET